MGEEVLTASYLAREKHCCKLLRRRTMVNATLLAPSTRWCMQRFKHPPLMFIGSKSPRYIQRQQERRFLFAIAPLVWFVGLLGIGLMAFAILQYFVSGRLPKLQFYAAFALLAFPLSHFGVIAARGHLKRGKKRRTPNPVSQPRANIQTRPIMPGTLRKRGTASHNPDGKRG